MSRSSISSLVVGLILVALVFSSPITSSHATSYLPALTPGQWGEYKVITNTCQPASSPICTLVSGSSLGDIDFGVLEVVKVKGTGVTLKLSTVSRSGVGSQQGVLVDVSSGASNITVFPQGPSGLQGSQADYLVLAGNLNARDGIWNTLSAPSLNQTLSEQVLGVPREVNVLNFTSSYSYLGETVSASSRLTFDRQYGILVDTRVSYTAVGPYGNAQGSFEVDMVDNHIWRSSDLPDFGLTASPPAINASQGFSGNSTITLTRVNGFSGTVSLTAVPSSTVITCSLSPSSLAMGGSNRSTLSCNGSSGTYTVLVRGDSGYSSHSESISVIVTDRITSSLGQGPISRRPLVFAGIGITGVIAALALILRRRKPKESPIEPREPRPKL